MQTAFSESRERWGPFIRELVGAKQGAAVGVSDLLRRFNTLRPTGTTRRTAASDEVTPEDRQRLYRQLSGLTAPYAENAWWIGEALNGWHPWCSGLVAVFAAAHISDFVGILGSLEVSEVRGFAITLSTMINSIYAATYENQLGMSVEQLYRLKQQIILTHSAHVELDRLKGREDARTLWRHINNSPTRPKVDAAAAKWFRGPRKPRLRKYLGHAYFISKDRSFSYVQRVKLVMRALTSWLHTEISEEPPELLFDVQGDLALLQGLDAPSARRARRGFLMQYLIAAETQEDDWFPGVIGPSDEIAARPPGSGITSVIDAAREELRNRDPRGS